MMHLRGTKFWPSFKKKIFFWELPESSCSCEKGEPLARVESFLTDFMLSGVFTDIAGMVVGRPKGYTNEEFQKLAEIIKFFTKEFDFPVLYNVDIGHTDPIMTLPIGVRVNLDSGKNSFEITEAAVK
jgi:muramoyltetrapeptide carboxypeptidase